MTHTAQEPDSLLTAVMKLQFTHVRFFACRSRL